jgi:hypothetical protein
VSTVKHYFPDHISDNEQAPEENSEANSKENEISLLLFQIPEKKLHIS